MRVAIAPYPRQHLELSVCQLVILIDVDTHYFFFLTSTATFLPWDKCREKSYLIKQGKESRGNLRVTLHNKQKYLLLHKKI